MNLNITLDGRRFYRSNTNQWLFGVCGGLAEHFGWKPWMVRLGVAVGAIALPGVSTLAVIVAYIALGITVPTRDQA